MCGFLGLPSCSPPGPEKGSVGRCDASLCHAGIAISLCTEPWQHHMKERKKEGEEKKEQQFLNACLELGDVLILKV